MTVTVSNVTGSGFTLGANLTITGSGWGTKSRNTPMFYSDWQAGAIAPVSGLSNKVALDWTQNVALVNDPANKRWGNGNVVKAAWTRDGTASGRSSELGVYVNGFNHGSKMFVAGWRKWTNPDTSGNWKWWRVWPSGGPGNYPNAYWGDPNIASPSPIWNLESAGANTSANHLQKVFFGPTTPTSTWKLEQLELDFNLTAGVGNGALKLSGAPNSVYADEGAFAFDWASETGPIYQMFFQNTKASTDPGASMNAWYGDFYVDDTKNRVVIGDNATYGNCSHIEIQPFSLWTSGSIVISLRPGTFTTGTGTYLFVLDANSTPNTAGFQLNALGGGAAAPVIISLSPSFGPSSGGTTVTATCTGLVATPDVKVNAVDATGETFINTNSMTFVTPAGTAGSRTVLLTNPDTQTGTSSFTYVAAPTAVSCTPSSGPLAGGTPFTLTCTGLSSTLNGIKINGVACTSVVRVSSVSATAVSPAATVGAHNIVVENSDGQTGTLTNGWTYVAAAPTVTSATVVEGPTSGGTATVLTGTGFSPTINSVKFGATAATSVIRNSPTSISCVTPAHAAGLVNIVVENDDAQTGTLVGGFTFLTGPTSISVTPATGDQAGNESVTVNGLNFTLTVLDVSFGSESATDVVVVGPTEITCKTPANGPGAVTVSVVNSDGQSGAQPSAFTYLGNPAPTIDSVAPSSSSITGLISITITGDNFLPGATVDLSGDACSDVVIADEHTITCTVPSHDAASLTVNVTNIDSQVGSLPNGFVYRCKYHEALRTAFEQEQQFLS